MSLSSTTVRNDYTGNGAVSSYSYTFRIFLKTDLVLQVADTSTPPIVSNLTVDVDYSVSGVGASGGGTITFIDAGQSFLSSGKLKTGYKLTIKRVRPITQTTDIRNQGTFFPETHEDTFDQIVMICQQLQEQMDRAVKLSSMSTTTGIVCPEPTASLYVGWNAAGTNLENKPAPANGVAGANGATWLNGAGVPSSAAGSVGDYYLDNATGNYYQKIDATTWTLKGTLSGPAGPTGPTGSAGANGQGVPTGGTTNQVLAKIDGTNFNTQWVNPGSTSPLTTKGDLYTFDTANARLPVGADGTILTADSTQAKGVKWAPAPTGFANPMTTLGDLMFEDATPTAARLAGNTTTTKKFLSQTGNGSVSAAPTWSQPAFSDLSGSPTIAQVNPVTGSTGTPQSITAAGGITSTAAVPFQTQFIKGSGGAVTVTAAAQISAGTVVGQIMYLIGADDTNTVTLSDGTGLSLNGSRTLANNSALTLMWNGSIWSEIAWRQ